MLHLLLVQAYLFAMQLTLAGKDADSYLLKNRVDDPLTDSRIKRWHRDGVILFILCVVPVLSSYWPLVILFALLTRLSVFDLAFNYWAGLPTTLLGSTSWVDQQFQKIFGANGAINKCASCFGLQVLLNLVLIFCL